ncbi:MAG: AraC family transcriptional regulator [Oscillospiraceae bacterium]
MVIRKAQHQLFAYLNFLFTFTRNKEILSNKESVHFGLEQAIKGIVYNSLIILTEQVKTPSSKASASSNIIDNALQYIGMHLNEKITLDELSSYCNTSKRNLQLLFHQYLDSTVIDYINNRRMVLASSYLRMNFRVSDVGPNIGIEDPAQFCRIFKKYYGLSPKRYQMDYKTNGMIFGADYK